MPDFPIPETPPRHPEETGGLSEPNATACEASRHHSGSSVPAWVQPCLADLEAGADEVVIAAVSLITTTYSAPGDRILLASPDEPIPASGQRRDKLVESVLRLGRGATTTPDHPHRRRHERDTVDEWSPLASRSESGCGPHLAHSIEPDAKPADRPRRDNPSQLGSDGFHLIIAGWSNAPIKPCALADWTLDLAPHGTVVVLTLSSDQCNESGTHSWSLEHCAAQAGLIWIDRLVLAHRFPPTPRPPTAPGRREIALRSHRCIHTTAHMFRRPIPQPDAGHA